MRLRRNRVSRTERRRQQREAEKARRGNPEKSQAVPRWGVMKRLRGAADTLLHTGEPTSPPWKYLPLTLVLAFVVRARGGFVLPGGRRVCRRHHGAADCSIPISPTFAST